MAKTFRELMTEISPAWLLTTHAKPFVEGIGEVKDALLWRMLEAVKARFPRYGTADALAALGAERGIPRAVGESLASYAGRLRGAWTSWLYAGTPTGMLRAFWDSGYPNTHLAIFNQRRYYLDEDKELVTVDIGEHSWKFRTMDDTFWSRFIVLFPEPLLQRWQDDGPPAPGSDEANLIAGIMRRWRPAHMDCDDILIATSERCLGFFPGGETMGTRPGTLGDRTTWTSIF